MTTLRRLLVLWLLMFWQGGFLFYAAVVVRIGGEVLGSPLEQGWITQRVTNWINLAGVAALTAWMWDVAVEPATASSRRRRWFLWSLLAVALAALAWLHGLMDRHLDRSVGFIADPEAFYLLHRWYLRVSTAQWAGSVVLSWWTLNAWAKPTSSPTDGILKRRIDTAPECGGDTERLPP